MELKKQGLNPHKDDIVMKFISNPKPVEKPVEQPAPVVENIITSTGEPVNVVVCNSEVTGATISIDEVRFAELQEKGYKNLGGEDREEYRVLKEKLNK